MPENHLYLTIRHAQLSDLEQLCCVRNNPTLFEQYLAECDGECAHFLVALIDQRIVGFGLVYLDVTKTGRRKSHLPKLSDLYVCQPYRQRGIGSALIRARELLAIDYGHTEIFVSIDPTESPDMIRLINKHGYHALQSEPYSVASVFYNSNGKAFEKTYSRIDFRKALKFVEKRNPTATFA